MAYQGYLIKVGNYIIPMSIIKAETYKVTHNSQDIDSTRDTDGVLHRQALQHNPDKVEFNTIPLLTNTQFNVIMKNIQNNYINRVEKRASVSVYVPELDEYITQDMYMADLTFEIYYAGSDMVKYNPIRFAFIGY